jgi:hypothetical protein
MAGLSAVRHNPAVRALYARLVKRHPNQKASAIGHAMRKLLHLAFAVWKSDRPFDPKHYPWTVPAHLDQEPDATPDVASNTPTTNDSDSDTYMSQNDQAAGLKRSAQPARREVTAACSSESLCPNAPISESPCIDFAHLKRQLPIARVLDQLGLSGRLRGSGPQKHCTCPIHRGDARGKSFSVHLTDNVFCCHDKACGKKGDVIDLWISARGPGRRCHGCGSTRSGRAGTSRGSRSVAPISGFPWGSADMCPYRVWMAATRTH